MITKINRIQSLLTRYNSSNEHKHFEPWLILETLNFLVSRIAFRPVAIVDWNIGIREGKWIIWSKFQTIDWWIWIPSPRIRNKSMGCNCDCCCNQNNPQSIAIVQKAIVDTEKSKFLKISHALSTTSNILQDQDIKKGWNLKNGMLQMNNAIYCFHGWLVKTICVTVMVLISSGNSRIRI